jgi:hypothetical protein
MKTIEQILALSKNPHYTLTKEELAILEAYRIEKLELNRKNDKDFIKVKSTFKKHKTDIEE